MGKEEARYPYKPEKKEDYPPHYQRFIDYQEYSQPGYNFDQFIEIDDSVTTIEKFLEACKLIGTTGSIIITASKWMPEPVEEGEEIDTEAQQKLEQAIAVQRIASIILTITAQNGCKPVSFSELEDRIKANYSEAFRLGQKVQNSLKTMVGTGDIELIGQDIVLKETFVETLKDAHISLEE